jgi:hypothetical protein
MNQTELGDKYTDGARVVHIVNKATDFEVQYICTYNDVSFTSGPPDLITYKNPSGHTKEELHEFLKNRNFVKVK